VWHFANMSIHISTILPILMLKMQQIAYNKRKQSYALIHASPIQKYWLSQTDLLTILALSL
jgi:hypothetical protein